MTTYTIYGVAANSGYTSCFSASVASVLDGTGSTIASQSPPFFLGFFDGAGTYYSVQPLIEWDTSSVSGSVTSATFSLYVSSIAGTNDDGDTMQLRLYDYGGVVNSGKYRTSAQIAAATLLAHSLSPDSGGYQDFTSDNLASNIGASTTRAVMSTDRFAAGGTPTAAYYIGIDIDGGSSTGPKLTISTLNNPSPTSRLSQPRKVFPGVAVTSGTTNTLHRALITTATTIGDGKPMMDPQRFRRSPWAAVGSQAAQHRSDQALFLVPPPATLARSMTDPQRFRRTRTAVAISATAPPSRLPLRVTTGTPFKGRFDPLPLRRAPRVHLLQVMEQPSPLIPQQPVFPGAQAMPVRRVTLAAIGSMPDQTARVPLGGSIWAPPGDDDETWTSTAPSDATWTPQSPGDATWN